MSAKERRGDWIVAWALVAGVFFGGLAVLISANGRSEREAAIAEAPVETNAEIIVVEQQRSGWNRLTGVTSYWYVPTIEFRLNDGSPYRTELDGEHDSEQFVVGDALSVTYAVDDPSSVVATERRWDYRVGVVWGWVLMSFALLVVGIVALAMCWYRRATRPRPRRR